MIAFMVACIIVFVFLMILAHCLGSGLGFIGAIFYLVFAPSNETQKPRRADKRSNRRNVHADAHDDASRLQSSTPKFVPPQIAPAPSQGKRRSKDRRTEKRNKKGDDAGQTVMWVVIIVICAVIYAVLPKNGTNSKFDKEVLPVVRGYLQNQNSTTEKMYWCTYTEPMRLKEKNCTLVDEKDMKFHYEDGGRLCWTVAAVRFSWGEIAHYKVYLEKVNGKWVIFQIGGE